MTTIDNRFLQKLGDRVATIGTDHPFSQGMRLVFITNSKYARKTVKVKTTTIERYMQMIGHGQSSGLHAAWVESHVTIIAIKPDIDTRVRMVELVAHEVSHYVDALFEQCNVKLVDTELRAYYLDWMVGKMMHQLKM